MAKFAVHKKGFFYTDEAWEDVDTIGSTVKVFDTLEEAKAEKVIQDVISIQNLKGFNAVDFFFYAENYDKKYEKMNYYYKTEFGLEIADKHYFDFPIEINTNQAQELLNILEISFHEVVEYADEMAPTPKVESNRKDYGDEEINFEDELQEF